MNNNTKICTRCQEEKEFSEFRFRDKKKGTLQCWCKKCFSIYEKDKWKKSSTRRKSNIEKNKERRLRNKQFVFDYLADKSCEECGIDDWRVLEFDHLDRSKKSFGVSDCCSRCLSIKRIQQEISKCRILCANCHRIHTREQCGWWDGSIPPS